MGKGGLEMGQLEKYGKTRVKFTEDESVLNGLIR